MKYIKKFDSKWYDIKVGEYIIADMHSDYGKDYMDYINSHVGMVVKEPIEGFFFVKYDDLPNIYTDNMDKEGSVVVKGQFIKHHSFDREKLELILKKDKFNI